MSDRGDESDLSDLAGVPSVERKLSLDRVPHESRALVTADDVPVGNLELSPDRMVFSLGQTATFVGRREQHVWSCAVEDGVARVHGYGRHGIVRVPRLPALPAGDLTISKRGLRRYLIEASLNRIARIQLEGGPIDWVVVYLSARLPISLVTFWAWHVVTQDSDSNALGDGHRF